MQRESGLTRILRFLAAGVAATLFWPGTARAGDEPDAIAILREADSATKRVKAVRYHARVVGTGAKNADGPILEGTFAGRRIKAGRGVLERVFGGGANVAANIRSFDATTVDPRTGEKTRIQVAADQKSIYQINHARKSFTVGPVGQADMLMIPVGRLMLLEFFHDAPFRDEIEGDTQRHEGTKEIGGVVCDVIHVVYSGRRGEARWYFGKQDRLPRRVDRLAGQGDFYLELSKLEVDPELDERLFTLECPEGFTEKPFAPEPPGEETRPLLKAGTAAPTWALVTPEGLRIRLEDLRGKVVVLDFWATWCGFCKMAMPELQKIHEEFADQPVRVLGLNCWERNGDPAAYMKDKGYTYSLLLKADEVAKDYHVTGIPTIYVIDGEGKIVMATSGYGPGTMDELRAVIRKNLKPREP